MTSAATEVNRNTPISDSEIFYRRVLPQDTKKVDGRVRPSSNAFSDRQLQPSIDRRLILEMQNLDATFTRQVVGNGVAKFKASDVRAIQGLQKGPKSFVANVEPDPVPENPAHCFVKLSPSLQLDEKSVFKKLLERISRLAEWEIEPGA